MYTTRLNVLEHPHIELLAPTDWSHMTYVQLSSLGNNEKFQAVHSVPFTRSVRILTVLWKSVKMPVKKDHNAPVLWPERVRNISPFLCISLNMRKGLIPMLHVFYEYSIVIFWYLDPWIRNVYSWLWWYCMHMCIVQKIEHSVCDTPHIYTASYICFQLMYSII